MTYIVRTLSGKTIDVDEFDLSEQYYLDGGVSMENRIAIPLHKPIQTNPRVPSSRGVSYLLLPWTGLLTRRHNVYLSSLIGDDGEPETIVFGADENGAPQVNRILETYATMSHADVLAQFRAGYEIATPDVYWVDFPRDATLDDEMILLNP